MLSVLAAAIMSSPFCLVESRPLRAVVVSPLVFRLIDMDCPCDGCECERCRCNTKVSPDPVRPVEVRQMCPGGSCGWSVRPSTRWR